MSRCVVDTNVAIVANGRPDPDDLRPPSVSCQKAAVTFLIDLERNGTVLLDVEGAIQREYHRHLEPSGQPGIGDRFYQEVLRSSPRLVERVDLPKLPDGEYENLPRPLIDSGFDPSDRKFAALANRESVPVFNAIDSDWIEHAAILAIAEIQVENLCGCDTEQWFAA